MTSKTGLTWINVIGDAGADENDIAIDLDTNVYVLGTVSDGGVLNLNDLEYKRQAETMSGTDAYVVKYTSSGGLTDWLLWISGANMEFGRSITTDASGYIYVTGVTQSMEITVGGVSCTVPPFTESAQFLAKITSDGSVVWVKLVASTDATYTLSKIRCSYDCLFASGFVSCSTSDGGTIDIDGTIVTVGPNETTGIFVCYTLDGSVKWFNKQQVKKYLDVCPGDEGSCYTALTSDISGVVLHKYEATGTIVWNCLNLIDLNNIVSCSLTTMHDKLYVMIAYTSNMKLMCIKDGVVIDTDCFRGFTGMSIVSDNTKYLYISGFTQNYESPIFYDTVYDIPMSNPLPTCNSFLAKIDSDGKRLVESEMSVGVYNLPKSIQCRYYANDYVRATLFMQ